MVFSTVSDLSGKAANLTGDTATFVIELPGKLIAAGGGFSSAHSRPQPSAKPCNAHQDGRFSGVRNCAHAYCSIVNLANLIPDT